MNHSRPTMAQLLRARHLLLRRLLSPRDRVPGGEPDCDGCGAWIAEDMLAEQQWMRWALPLAAVLCSVYRWALPRPRQK